MKTDISEFRSQVSAISATIAHLATKADVAEVRTAVADLRADLSVSIFGSRAELSAGLGQARADQAAAETAKIKWIIGTVLASTTLAFTIAKFVH